MTMADGVSGCGAEPRTLVVLQPSYLPWLGYFDLVRRSDVFLFYDTVQYDARGWRNRNRIKARNGRPQWLTVPVHARRSSRISDVEIDRSRSWPARHMQSLRHNYARAPHAARYLRDLEGTLTQGWERIADLDIAVVQLMCDWMGLKPRFVRASALDVQGSRDERLLAYCRHFGAARYLSGNSAQAYLDVALFERHGVEVVWQDYRHPVYPQLHGEFVPFLSALDLILNCADDSLAIITSGSAKVVP